MKDMNLNLADASNLKPHLRDAESRVNSPDLGLLRLASPELDRLITQSNGLLPTTPTPHFLYPKTVSDEQEFAEGFVKALEDLHKQNQLNGITCAQTNSMGIDLSPHVAPVTMHPDLPVYTNLNGYDSGLLGAVNYPGDTGPFPPPPPPPPGHHPAGLARLRQLKDEPQTVPDGHSFGDSPPMSPINMDRQERIKAERKKLRNRIAASKCRKRKLERISRLEDKVKSLKTQNSDLASTASALREQVAQLKQKVLNHVNSGCQLLPQVQVY